MINSEQYWEDRFKSGSWDEWDGEKQTEFFTDLAIKYLPSWIKEDIVLNELSILDAGCAKGDGTHLLKKSFSRSKITGIDFSSSAIKFAQEKYPACKFECEDIGKIKDSYDIVFCSNVLEHFIDPFDKMKSLLKTSKKYFIVLLPFQEKELSEEHFTVFDYSSFKLADSNFYLSHYKVINTEILEKTMWLGKQILLIYTNNDYLSQNKMVLSRMHNSDFEEKDTIQKELLECVNSKEKIAVHMEKQNQIIIGLEKDSEALKVEINMLKAQINSLKETVQNDKIEKLSIKDKYEKEIAILDEKLNIQNQIKQELLMKINNIEVASNIQEDKLEKYVDIIDTANQITHNLNNTKMFKFVHLMYRIKHQLLKGDYNKRKEFCQWLNNRCNKRNPILSHEYNPMFQIINELEKSNKYINYGNKDKNHHDYLKFELNECGATDELIKFWNEQEEITTRTLTEKENRRVEKLKEIIKRKQYKGIIVYPHIVNWEPLQTPQQLLREFAKQGYLCIFSENPNTGVQEEEIEPNIILTNDQIMLKAVEEEQVVALCTWIPMLPVINKINNKIVWYHVLDQIDIFSGYCDEYERLHDELVQSADVISYVAHDLQKCLNSRTDAVYLPNGCNTQDFICNVDKDYMPEELKDILGMDKKIIGYYGYVAKWFNMEMIYNLLNKHEEWIFLIIGESIEDFARYQHDRIILLGRKPYKELANYAKYFDVATIPFEISSMMDCVSPIKFFEYCALGLPVVSSYMKEMEQFKGETVFVANNQDEFEFYINRALESGVKQLAKEQNTIALENTWEKRIQKIEPCLRYASKKNIHLTLKKKYEKVDILFLSVIDYNFRYQRPQHLATSFSKEGHRVFYVNANYNQNQTQSVKQVDNIDIISVKSDRYSAIHIADYTKDSSDIIKELEIIVQENAITDCAIVVEYPTWVQAAKYFKEKYGFRIITDYLDDYTGFEDTNIKCLAPCCYELLECSDRVVASSNYLAESAQKYNENVDIIRNGTEFEHFHQAYQKEKQKDKFRKTVGYYGAIAHWFDFKKIIYLAEALPEVDIVLIGQVTENIEILNKYSNIKLLGEKKYSILPKYLEEFDVCLIPFDTSTDLIKATNPVKFYEYLSAAKKIVATEIPELMPFRNQYVYLSNDNEEFLEYVKLCLDNKDSLASREECIEFAKENDWQERGGSFISSIKNSFPKVSIVVLTYNQLAYTKECIESIMTKTAYPNYEVIIVDNKSSDDTPDYLSQIQKQYDNVKIILNDVNYGFAKGNNIGIKSSNGDYIVLLNNDTVITRGWLTNFIKHYEKNPKLGILGPVTNSISNESKINVSYTEINEMDYFAYEYTLEHMGETYDKINVLAMFCLVISRKAFNEIGYLEELYGIGMFEDDDYSYKTRSLDYDIKCAEDVFIHHYGNVSFKKLEDKEYMEIFNKNKKIFEDRWNVKWQQHQYRPGVQ